MRFRLVDGEERTPNILNGALDSCLDMGGSRNGFVYMLKVGGRPIPPELAATFYFSSLVLLTGLSTTRGEH
jgi:hypothetical protein